ncbi:unnamed protein product [Periconia digitata]|uniref:Uncharacterized protein n=1 Tax=Periconia digitata TaxID=1303443 RepID=A0A9W4XMW8_9PLEO|nr:unnamed protein product [Periconia digitata]
MSQQMRPSLDDPNAWVPYRYHPSRTAAIVFIVAFSLTTILHTAQLIRKKTWYFIPMVVGGIFEVVGFVGRALSTNDLWALGPFIMQSLLLLVAPALFAASIYIILGRVILLVDGDKLSLIRQRWLTKIFVTGDVISFVVQAGGGGIQAAGTLDLLHLGEKVIIVGLFLQLAFFGFFIVVAAIFHRRLAKLETNASHQSSQVAAGPALGSSGLPWKRYLYTLYIASALIMIRSIFRVVEYLQGNNGFLLRREYFLYIFDALLMFLVMALFNWIHPSGITDLYQKRLADATSYDMDDTRERYMGYSGAPKREETHAEASHP